MKTLRMLIFAAAVLALVGLTLWALPVTRTIAQNTLCYLPQGGAAFQCDATGKFLNAGWMVDTPAAAITVTSMITPVSSFQKIQNWTGAQGAVMGPPAGFTSGTLVIIENISDQVITITDTGTAMLAGNVALGQYDTLTLRNDGTNWVQVSTSNN